jgi:cell division protein FtsN
MLRKVIAAGVAGLGISAVAMVTSAMPEENPLQLLQRQISRLTEAIQRKITTDEERFNRIEEDVRQLKQRPDNTTTVQPSSVQPSSAQPSSAQPTSAQPSSVRPITVRPMTVRPSSVQPPRHRHYYPRYVGCPRPWCEPWW